LHDILHSTFDSQPPSHTYKPNTQARTIARTVCGAVWGQAYLEAYLLDIKKLGVTAEWFASFLSPRSIGYLHPCLRTFTPPLASPRSK